MHHHNYVQNDMVYNIHKLNRAVATVDIYYVPAVTGNVVNGLLFIYF